MWSHATGLICVDVDLRRGFVFLGVLVSPGSWWHLDEMPIVMSLLV